MLKSRPKSPDRAAYRRRRSAFTLIELMIVISIISLLISIVIPAITAARAQARAALCGTRLRLMGQAWTAYTGENKDRSLPSRLPVFVKGAFSNPANQYKISTGAKYRPRWPALMQPQIGIPALNAPSPTKDRQDYESSAYTCPDAANWLDERNSAFGYNYQFLGNERLKAKKERNPAVPQTRLLHLADTVVAGDCAGTAVAYPLNDRLDYENNGRNTQSLGNTGWLLDPPRLDPKSSRADGAGTRSGPDTRHRGKANMVFGDGHVAPCTLKGLGYQVLENGAVAAAGPDATNRLFSGTLNDDSPP